MCISLIYNKVKSTVVAGEFEKKDSLLETSRFFSQPNEFTAAENVGVFFNDADHI